MTSRNHPGVALGEGLGEAVPIRGVTVSSFTIPTEEPESDGTLEWDATGVVVVEVEAGGHVGLGYTYEHEAAAYLIRTTFVPLLHGRDALAPRILWQELYRQVRNIGRGGVAARAISAVDTALWDLQAKLLGVSLVTLLGPAHESVAVYGSGGFTSYTRGKLQQQLAAWVEAGIPRVKMKVGRHPGEDLRRVAAARQAIGADAALYVDANGAYQRKQALMFSRAFAEYGVSWHEEPVTSDDREGLRLLRDRGPAGMDIAAGEYGDHLAYFRDLLAAGAVDCLQVDVTRCGGFTVFLETAALCRAHAIPLSSHTAPQLSAHACAATPSLRHLEWFHDHVRVEDLLFDGVLEPRQGALRPDRSRPGHGLELKHADAERYTT